jgi:subtilisin family serine protease
MEFYPYFFFYSTSITNIGFKKTGEFMKSQQKKSKNYLMIILLSLVSVYAHSHETKKDKEYLVTFQTGQINDEVLQKLDVLLERGGKTFAKGKLSQEQFNRLDALSDVFIEENTQFTLNAGTLRSLSSNSHNANVLETNELEPYWLRATKINELPNTAESVPVCVIDSGLDSEHPDLPERSKLKGYHSSYAGFWDNDAFSHGTHITGIIAAQENGVGVKGALSESNTSIYVSKLIKTANGANSKIWGSDLIEAIENCANFGAKVINMSLSGESPSTLMRNVIDRVSYKNDVIFVGAAGNHGTALGKSNGEQDKLHYPASYHNVLSVGALNENGVVADFSPINNRVDFVAPGTKILSTANRYYHAIQAVELDLLTGYTKVPYTQIDTGTSKPSELATVNESCKYTLSGSAISHFLESGNFSSSIITALKNTEHNCRKSEGQLVIIDYANAENVNLHRLPIYTDFPTILVHKPLESLNLGSKVRVSYFNDSYVMGYGTSQAAAIITGGIAKLWSQNQDWTREKIINALKHSSHDLGAPGKDNRYGYGLPNFKKAYEDLRSNFQTACPQTWYFNKAYLGGEKVVYNGAVFVSKHWSKNENPESNSAVWIRDGYCESSTGNIQNIDNDAFHLMDLNGLEKEDAEYSCKGLTLGCGG